MSSNWCITATKDWVLKNCPYILSNEVDQITFRVGNSNGWEDKIEKYALNRFLRFPDENGEVYGTYDWRFLPWCEENFGVTYHEDNYWNYDENDEAIEY